MIQSGFYSMGFRLKIWKHDREILPGPSDSEGEVDRRRESACAGVVDAAGGGRGQGHREPAGRGRGPAAEDGELCRRPGTGSSVEFIRFKIEFWPDL